MSEDSDISSAGYAAFFKFPILDPASHRDAPRIGSRWIIGGKGPPVVVELLIEAEGEVSLVARRLRERTIRYDDIRRFTVANFVQWFTPLPDA